MCALAASASLEIKIARCYAFVGPHLPLDAHFAAGNFLRDALAGRPIHIASDGSSVRSYLYAADLTVALWTMLFRAPSMRAYNIGSEEAITIRELAELTARTVNPSTSVTGGRQSRSCPHAAPLRARHGRASDELSLRQTVPLAEALARTAAWHRLTSQAPPAARIENE